MGDKAYYDTKPSIAALVPFGQTGNSTEVFSVDKAIGHKL